MKHLKSVNLNDLPKIFSQSTEETRQRLEDIYTQDEIDGSSMTINPDKKFRLSRVITSAELAKYKRPTKIRELLDYCKFRLGEIATCTKPSPSVINVLYWYKGGHIDKISPGYMEAIKDYKELIDKAMEVDMRKVNTKKKTVKCKSRTQHTLDIDGIKIVTSARQDQTIKCAKAFIEWLDIQETAVPWTIEGPAKYMTQIKTYLTDKTSYTLQPAIKQILDQRPWLIENYEFIKQGKRQVLSYVHAKPDNSTKQVTSKPGTSNMIQPKPIEEYKVPDTLTMLIKLAKQAGATEVTIKL